MKATVDYVARVCVDCYFAHHYGWHEHDGSWYAGDSDTPADREPLALIPAERYVADDTAPGDDGNADDGFSWSSCDGCGSTLGGDRYRLAVFTPEPDPMADAIAAGTAHGNAAGSWVIDGNTSEDTAREVLRMIADGDPEWDPPAPLSGEWGGDPLPATVLADLDVAEDDPAADDYLRAYEDAFYTAYTDTAERDARGMIPDPEVIAVASVSCYVILRGEGGEVVSGGIETFPATDDPDEHAERILAELRIPDGIGIPSDAFPQGWRQSGGDDHGDGLTSYDYVASLADLDAVRAILDYAGSNEPGDGTPNGGILTGQEFGYIPGGTTWDLDGMEWNVGGVTRIAGASVAVFPITEDAADLVFPAGWREGEGS